MQKRTADAHITFLAPAESAVNLWSTLEPRCPLCIHNGVYGYYDVYSRYTILKWIMSYSRSLAAMSVQ